MKKIRFSFIVIASLGLLFMASCNDDDGGQIINRLPQTRAINLSAEQKAMVQTGNEFSLDLFREVYNYNGAHSISFAPMGAIYMLGMVGNGATDEAQKEIVNTMGFGNEGIEGVNLLCQRLIDEAPMADESVTLEVANAVFGGKGLKLREAYKKTVNKYYGAKADVVDFSSPEALAQINNWCKEKSHGKIDEMVTELDPLTRAIVLNSIYFDAGWNQKFDKKLTKEEDFITESGNIQGVRMMHSNSLINHAENEYCRMVRLPYGGLRTNDELGWDMYVILPKEGKTVKDVLDKLDNNTWMALRNAEQSKVLELGLPKFKVTSNTPLIDVLPGMGVINIFKISGSLNRMFEPSKNGGPEPLITNMFQESGIEVNEDGSKMITITVSEVKDGACDIDYLPANRQFLANRPFIYLISEGSSGAIFFTGVYHGE